MISALILAAGRGERLGSVAKALLRVGDASYLEHIAGVARRCGIESIRVVVGGPHESRTAEEARRIGAEVCTNDDAERGMASSVEVAFRAVIDADDGVESTLLWPVDHARVEEDTVRALLFRARAQKVVIPRYRGRGGHPALVGRALWSELARCSELEAGARSVWRADPTRIEYLDVEDRGVVADVDTPADLR